ncbi:hypothetical protein YUWDRAFT_01496 [Streptomyces sp. AmelKG-D3]|nr:hypothetical protein YUWDRAFT_01496 [Streptomyces sp. AmelKG-D3]
MTAHTLSPLPDGHGARADRPPQALARPRSAPSPTALAALLPRDALCGRYFHGHS